MKRHASPIARPLSERVRLARDFILGSLFLGGLLALLLWLFLFWQPQ